jgi:hypothetical protein
VIESVLHWGNSIYNTGFLVSRSASSPMQPPEAMNARRPGKVKRKRFFRWPPQCSISQPCRRATAVEEEEAALLLPAAAQDVSALQVCYGGRKRKRRLWCCRFAALEQAIGEGEGMEEAGLVGLVRRR